jgi:hypothetical protein
MNKFLFSALFSIYSVICLSQEVAKTEPGHGINIEKKFSRYYFSEIITGIAIPSGEFAGSDPENTQSGFANLGGFLFAGYGRMYYKMIGFETALTISFNPLNSSIDQVKKQNEADSYNHDAGWVIINYLAGPRFSIPAGKFAFEGRFLAGLMDARRPAFKNTYTGLFITVMEEKVGHGYAFVYQLGAGLKYSISKRIGIKLLVDYFKALPTIRYEETGSAWTVDKGYYFEYHERKYKQPVSDINLGLGIEFHIR